IRQLAVAFAEIQRLHRSELNDLALVVERHGGRAKAAKHALAPEFPVEHIEMPHAIEHRDDRGLWSDRCRKRLDRVVEIECLAAQQDGVELFGELVGLNRRRIFQGHVAVRALDHQARVLEFAGAPRADQKRHIAAGLQHSAAEISADRAGADYENAHWGSSFLLLFLEANSEWRIANSE